MLSLSKYLAWLLLKPTRGEVTRECNEGLEGCGGIAPIGKSPPLRVRHHGQGDDHVIGLTKPIADHIKANARLDLDGMLNPFRHDAVFIDNGKRFEGQAAIRHLLEEEVIPVKAIFTPDVIRELAWERSLRR